MNDYNSYKQELENIKELVELNSKENDDSLSADIQSNLSVLESNIKKIELFCFLSKKNFEHYFYF